MKKWRMIIDVARCEDCNNCTLACKDVRSLSGLSRLDGGVLWPDLLPGQFR
jgi:Fe-S-cluster-containing dehydrogenase component